MSADNNVFSELQILNLNHRLDKIRKRYLIMLLVRCLLLFPLLIGALFILNVDISGGHAHLEFLNEILAFSALALLTFLFKPLEKYRQKMKHAIFPSVLNKMGKDFTFSYKTDFKVNSLSEFHIVPPHDFEQNHDHMSGSYKDVKIELVESKLTSKQGRKRQTVFNGVFIKLSSNKKFAGKTLVMPRIPYLPKIFISKSFQEVRLENPEFNKIFTVLSTDQIEARYLLTVTFMERLLDLRLHFNNRFIDVSFYNNQILFKIATGKSWFEVGPIYKKCDVSRDAALFMQDMKTIFGIIHILKLDQRTGL